MNLDQLISSCELGLIYGLVALGVYLSFRILQFPDLTVDGSFPLGAAVCAASVYAGFGLFEALLLACVAGFLAGLLTAWLSTRLNFLNLLAGILTMTALYSVNLRIMGKPNMSLAGESSLFSFGVHSLIILGVIVGGCFLLCWWFLRTDLGLALRATGSNPRMGRAQGVNDEFMIWFGIAASNGFVALAGALYCQLQGFADVGMGLGTIVIGLASVIMGESLITGSRLWQVLGACLVGSILYRILISFALGAADIGLKASDLNIVTALLLGFALILPKLKKQISSKLA